MVMNVVYTSLEVIFKIWVFKDWLANLRCIVETSADSIHDCLTLHLTPVGSIVNNYGRNDVATMGVPILNLVLNDFILCFQFHPVIFVSGSETFRDATHSSFPIESM